MKNVALHNLGCKVNAYELDVMQQMLQEKGYKIVPFDEEADIYIINTCTVTNIADRKSRQMLHRAKAKNPDAVVVATGCYVQTGTQAVEMDPCIDLAIGNNKKKDLVAILEAYLEEREHAQDKPVKDIEVIDINNTFEYETMNLVQTADHTRAYIKIQDGCNQFCTYCIIPYARGRVRSRKEEDIMEEIHGLTQKGYKEIVLTGIHISSYGIDHHEEERHDYSGESKLIPLIEKIHEIPGVERIRLGSLEPRVVTKEAARKLASLKKVCPHFHLSLQSGCNETLKRMNRRYTAGEYLQCVENLREVYDHPAITTDVIVGFPGETEEEFQETQDFLEKIRFYEMHIFKYSKRQGTKAAVMQGQVNDQLKNERSKVLIAKEQIWSKEFRAAYVGQEAEVLFEEEKQINGSIYQIGHTRQYVKVAKQAEESLSNRMIIGQIEGFLTDDILLMK